VRPAFIDPKRRSERRLFDINERLQKLRTELGVIEEQLVELADQAEEAKVRAVVAETAFANQQWDEARRHAEQLAHARDNLRHEISKLEKTQDELIEKLVS
jgi:flagellar biosynthesis chaperone FliJ